MQGRDPSLVRVHGAQNRESPKYKDGVNVVNLPFRFDFLGVSVDLQSTMHVCTPVLMRVSSSVLTVKSAYGSLAKLLKTGRRRMASSQTERSNKVDGANSAARSRYGWMHRRIETKNWEEQASGKLHAGELTRT